MLFFYFFEIKKKKKRKYVFYMFYVLFIWQPRRPIDTDRPTEFDIFFFGDGHVPPTDRLQEIKECAITSMGLLLAHLASDLTNQLPEVGMKSGVE